MPLKAVCTFGALLLASASATAQFPIGGGSATPLPQFSCTQPWLGRPDFTMQLTGVLGGSTGFICLSGAPGASNVLGLPIFIDLEAVLAPPIIFTADGPPGVPGAGSWSMTLPLTFLGPDAAGVSIFGQAAIDDMSMPGGFVVSTGLEFSVTLMPQVFGATVASGTAAQYAFLNGVTLAPDHPSVPEPLASNLVGAVYADGGSRLYVAAGNSINVADLTGPAPVWSTFFSVAAFMAGDGAGVAYDRSRKIIWTVAIPAGGSQVELIGLNADTTSAGYGTVLHQTTGFGAFVGNGSTPIGPWSLRSDGRRLAILDGTPKTLHVYDLDPASPTFLSPLNSILAPGVGGIFPTYAGAKFSRNGAEVLVIRTPIFGTTEIARFSLATGQFIDHNLLAPGIQSIGPNSLPSVVIPASTNDLSPLPNGDILLCGSGGLGFTAKLLIGQGPLPSLSLLASPTPTPAATRIAADIDGGRCVVGALQFGTTPTVFVFDTATMTLLLAQPIAPASFTSNAVKSLAWR